jgi:hypothetical protein
MFFFFVFHILAQCLPINIKAMQSETAPIVDYGKENGSLYYADSKGCYILYI